MSPDFHIPYIIPTALLAAALVLKLPTLVRAFRDPDVRATSLLLFCATAVLIVITPVNIHRLNVWTGIPNIAAPWAYSFLTAFCATGLTMIMRWREPPSHRRRRRMITVYWIYAAIIAGLWCTFLLADVPEPRIYDLDTHYADTSWMREHILLYVLAHLVSSLIAAYMLWRWFPEVNHPWLKAGVVFLQAGYASGLVFDVAKLTAIAARWSGNNLDFLSTRAAPPFALLEAILVALGFIVPQVGPFLQKQACDRREYLLLRSLQRTVRPVEPAAAEPRLGAWASVDLRLMHRQQRIHDALRVLGPYFDQQVYRRAYREAAIAHRESKARGLAGALAVEAAVDAYLNRQPQDTERRLTQISSDITEHLIEVAKALYRTRDLDRLRRSAETRSVAASSPRTVRDAGRSDRHE